jgi:hypothetical protein
LEPLKLFVSNPKVSFKALTKFGTNLIHFVGTNVNEMKLRASLCSKRSYSQSKSNPPTILNNYQAKMYGHFSRIEQYSTESSKR